MSRFKKFEDGLREKQDIIREMYDEAKEPSVHDVLARLFPEYDEELVSRAVLAASGMLVHTFPGIAIRGGGDAFDTAEDVVLVCAVVLAVGDLLSRELTTDTTPATV